MFKYSKDGISVLVVLDTRRAKRSGLYPVKVQVVYMRTQKYYSTGKELSKTDWENLPEARSRRLTEIRADIENSFSLIKTQVEALAVHGEFCFDTLSARLGRCTAFTVNAAILSKMEELKANDQAGTYTSYHSMLKKVEKFAGKEIPFSAITVEWLNRCERSWVAGGLSYSSISFYFRNLKCIINQARKDGIVKEAQYPFGKGRYEVPKGNSCKLALTLKEIKQLVSFTDDQPETEEYRDLWFFSYLCNGINFKDMLYLKYSDIAGGEICFVRAKTARSTKHGKVIYAVVTPQMQAIIDRWGNPPATPGTLIFRYAKGTENNFEKMKLVQKVVVECNKVLDRISRRTGIPKVTTYAARHSYATVLKRSGANIAYISESLGHSSLAITEHYLASFEQEERQKHASLLTKFED
ncbi:MAG: site-specific integrase [Tannerellaceae bacterium]|jgi:integrase|nr:site-specific integrase [Tannerellaceae bacterium]